MYIILYKFSPFGSRRK